MDIFRSKCSFDIPADESLQEAQRLTSGGRSISIPFPTQRRLDHMQPIDSSGSKISLRWRLSR
jgi:hypothetical protein